ncbi:MAG: M48 family metallopeptidase [Deltaproteobacteria bacterium]|nr:M48 family metallopeptidase [Deltaproteobacteria bacterium]
MFLFSLLLIQCSKDPVTGKKSYNWFNRQQEIALGEKVLASQLKAFKQAQEGENKKPVSIDEDEEQLKRLRRIVHRLAKVSHVPDFPYEVHLADSPVVNAWCAPGGKIMVYRGLWDKEKGLVKKDNEDEIAAVLAHEIAHATSRHVTESLSTHITIGLAGSVATTAIGEAHQDLGDIFSTVFVVGYTIFVPTYSRRHESEADRVGLFYMAKAGYDPRAAVRLWQRAAQRKNPKASSIFASHPPSGKRAKDLEKYLPMAMELYRNPQLPYPNFSDL